MIRLSRSEHRDPRRQSSARILGTVLAEATRRLRMSGSPSARLDAEVLLAHAAGRDRSWIVAHPEVVLDGEVNAEFVECVARRAAGEPVAYIRGFKEWRSLRIRTDARALIPRPETELVVEAAGAEIRSRGERAVVWDLATGSGAIALALALDFRDALAGGRMTLIASDVSRDALDLAAENLAEHGVVDAVHLVEADLLAPAGARLPSPDVVTANLPYVSSAEVDERRGSLGFEPRIAVDGGPDGLALLRRFLGEARDHTAPGATLLLELGVDQAEIVRRLAPEGASVDVVRDLAGLDRVVRIALPT